MRGCITLLTFMFMLALPFIVFGYSLAAFIVMLIIFSALWLLTKGAEALGHALEQDEEEDDGEEEHRSV